MWCGSSILFRVNKCLTPKIFATNHSPFIMGKITACDSALEYKGKKYHYLCLFTFHNFQIPINSSLDIEALSIFLQQWLHINHKHFIFSVGIHLWNKMWLIFSFVLQFPFRMTIIYIVAAFNTANKVPLWMDVLFHDDKNWYL